MKITKRMKFATILKSKNNRKLVRKFTGGKFCRTKDIFIKFNKGTETNAMALKTEF